MSNVIPFNFESIEIRALKDENGEPWFNANDICAALEMGNPRQAIESHVDPEDVQKLDTLTSGGRQRQNHVNESGVYALILGSKKESAKRFKRWVTSEVLPAIRKTGSYQPENLSRMDILQMAIQSEQERLKLVEEKRELEERIEQDAPAVAFAKAVEVAPDAISVAQAAKIIGTGRRRLFAFLRQIAWVTRHNEPYQAKIEAGLLDVKIGQWEHPEKGLQKSVTALVTGRGLAKLQALWEQNREDNRAA